MNSFSTNDISSAITPSLNIAVSEDSAPIQADQPILTHLYFGDENHSSDNHLSIQTSLNVLGSSLFTQYWFTDNEVSQCKYKNVQYAFNQQMLFGHIQLPCEDDASFITNSEHAYQEIFECLKKEGCKHLLRTWNYFPAITDKVNGHAHTNRYELFCSARINAMQKCDINNEIYPAATVIGNQNKVLQVYFLASDTPGIAVENPRQTSAYHYPIVETVKRPLFSRGILKVWGNRTHFYVSGTASIVGHQTLHVDDVCAQLNESINNVETLVAHANDQHQTQLNAQDDLLYMKVYIRHSKDVAQIKQVLAARLSGTTPRILLLGDMCREDLLVEIEAFYQA
ncbi:MAG: hypothetical protein ACR2PU_02545 [Gammaproteobacteria bacterium]